MSSLAEQQESYDSTAGNAVGFLAAYISANEKRLVKLGKERAFTLGVDTYGAEGKANGRRWLVETDHELADAIYYVVRYMTEVIPAYREFDSVSHSPRCEWQPGWLDTAVCDGCREIAANRQKETAS